MTEDKIEAWKMGARGSGRAALLLAPRSIRLGRSLALPAAHFERNQMPATYETKH